MKSSRRTVVVRTADSSPGGINTPWCARTTSRAYPPKAASAVIHAPRSPRRAPPLTATSGKTKAKSESTRPVRKRSARAKIQSPATCTAARRTRRYPARRSSAIKSCRRLTPRTRTPRAAARCEPSPSFCRRKYEPPVRTSVITTMRLAVGQTSLFRNSSSTRRAGTSIGGRPSATGPVGAPLMAVASLDGFGHREDRQVHGGDEETDDAAHEDDEDGLDHRGQGADRGIDLLVVEVGDLAQHGVHGAGGLAHADHLHHHLREDADLRERLNDGPALGDLAAHLEDRLLEDDVARGLGGDVHRVEDGHARGEHGPQRPREARHRHLPEEVAEDRRLEQTRIDDAPPELGPGENPKGDDDGDDAGDEVEDVGPQPLGEVDDELGGPGQIAARRLEHVLEDRRHEEQ